MKRIAFIASVTIVLAGCILLLLSCDAHQDDALEHARRLVCQNNQKSIYSALLQYHKKNETLPPDLKTLIQNKYIREKDVYCPSNPDSPNIQAYEYYPDNFGDPNLPLISENVDNHSGRGLRLKRHRPAIIQTMGDGTIITLNVEEKK
ncbi:MAG: DUF1559 domain-containing protein [Sedimentisphaerales bacterium]